MTKKAPRVSTKSGNSRRVLIPATVGHDKTALEPNNPRVKNIAFKLRWTPDTVIRRVETSLTSRVEQQLYLRVAGGFRIQPESMKKLLDVFRGSQDLQESDLQQFEVGKNLVTSRFDEVMEKVQHALVLLDKTSDGAEYMMSMNSAARLVEAYGDHSQEVFGEIFENVGEVAQLLGLKTSNVREIVGVAVKILVEEVIGKRQGVPLPLTVNEMFSQLGRERREYS